MPFVNISPRLLVCIRRGRLPGCLLPVVRVDLDRERPYLGCTMLNRLMLLLIMNLLEGMLTADELPGVVRVGVRRGHEEAPADPSVGGKSSSTEKILNYVYRIGWSM